MSMPMDGIYGGSPIIKSSIKSSIKSTRTTKKSRTRIISIVIIKVGRFVNNGIIKTTESAGGRNRLFDKVRNEGLLFLPALWSVAGEFVVFFLCPFTLYIRQGNISENFLQEWDCYKDNKVFASGFSRSLTLGSFGSIHGDKASLFLFFKKLVDIKSYLDYVD